MIEEFFEKFLQKNKNVSKQFTICMDSLQRRKNCTLRSIKWKIPVWDIHTTCLQEVGISKFGMHCLNAAMFSANSINTSLRLIITTDARGKK